jgi:hypothetical protein
MDLFFFLVRRKLVFADTKPEGKRSTKHTTWTYRNSLVALAGSYCIFTSYCILGDFCVQKINFAVLRVCYLDLHYSLYAFAIFAILIFILAWLSCGLHLG